MNIKKQSVTKGFIYLVRTVGILICLIVLYVTLAGIGMIIPTNRSYRPAANGIPVFVTTNGFHTDIILPVQNRRDKCFRILQQSDLSTKYANYPYVSFGWGDRNFYMESYNNHFPAVTTILSTLFIPGKTLMHIDFYAGAPRTGKQVKKLMLTPEQYERLVDFINTSFLSEQDVLAKLPQAGYYDTDYFFEANGRYHLFNTCNVWTGEALAAAGIKVSYWTPLESAVFYYL